MAYNPRRPLSEISDHIKRQLKKAKGDKDYAKIEKLKATRESQKKHNKKTGIKRRELDKKIKDKSISKERRYLAKEEKKKLFSYDLKLIDNEINQAVGKDFFISVHGRAGDYKVHSEIVAKQEDPAVFFLKKELDIVNKFYEKEKRKRKNKDEFKLTTLDIAKQKIETNLNKLKDKDYDEEFSHTITMPNMGESIKFSKRIQRSKTLKITDTKVNEDGTVTLTITSETDPEILTSLIGSTITIMY